MAAANGQNGLSVTLAKPITRENMNAKNLLAWARSWLIAEAKSVGVSSNTKDGKRRLQELRRMLEDTEDGSKFAGTAVEDILPSDWLAAVIGGLKYVPRSNSLVLILDSATFSIPESFARKTVWRVMAGRQVFSPVPMSTDQLDPIISASGQVSNLDVAAVQATEASFYTSMDVAEPEGRRRLRSKKTSEKKRALQEGEASQDVDDDLGVDDDWLFGDDDLSGYYETDDFDLMDADDEWGTYYDDDYAGLAYDDDYEGWEYDYEDMYDEYTDDYGDLGFFFHDDDLYGYATDDYEYGEDFLYVRTMEKWHTSRFMIARDTSQDDDFWEDESHLEQTQRSTTMGETM